MISSSITLTGVFWRTKLLTFQNRITVINKSHKNLLLNQKATRENSFSLPSKKQSVFHWTDNSQAERLFVSVDNGDNWSSYSLLILPSDLFELKVNNGNFQNESAVLLVSINTQNLESHVIFEDQDKNFPLYLIQNLTPNVLFFFFFFSFRY